MPVFVEPLFVDPTAQIHHLTGHGLFKGLTQIGVSNVSVLGTLTEPLRFKRSGLCGNGHDLI